jgi:hypothetical protein
MSYVGSLKHTGTLDLDAFGAAEVDRGGRVEAETGVAVLVVVLMWVIVSRPRCRM